MVELQNEFGGPIQFDETAEPEKEESAWKVFYNEVFKSKKNLDTLRSRVQEAKYKLENTEEFKTAKLLEGLEAVKRTKTLGGANKQEALKELLASTNNNDMNMVKAIAIIEE